MAENKNAKTPTDDGQPVAWLKTWSDGSMSVLKTKSCAFADHELEPLYAAPQKAAEWVGLTEKEWYEATGIPRNATLPMSMLKGIEKALKEKNHGQP